MKGKNKMCLRLKTNWCKKQNGYGWKLFLKNYDNTLSGIYYNKLESYQYNKWYKDKSKYLIFLPSDYNNPYRSGFHMYKTRKQARNNREKGYEYVKKVEYRNLICSGIEYMSEVIVAKEMLILK